MTTKGIIVTLVTVIAIGAAVYFVLPKDKGVATPTGTTTETASTNNREVSNDELIDSLVEGITSDETKEAEATIDTTTPPSQENVAGSVKTDF